MALFDSYSGVVTDNAGNSIAGATIKVYNADNADPLSASNTLAVIYSDRQGATEIDQEASPLQSAAKGAFRFYVVGGFYHILVESSGETSAIADVAIGTAGSLDTQDIGGSSFEVLESITGDLVITDVGLYNLENAFETGNTFEGSAQGQFTTAMYMFQDGFTLLIANNTNTIFQYDLSTAYQLSSAVYNNVSFTHSSNVFGIEFNPAGSVLYLCSRSATKRVAQIELSTPFDITSGVATTFFTPSQNSDGPADLRFNLDGTEAFITDIGTDVLSKYILSIAYDLQTAVYSGDFLDLIGSGTTVPFGFNFLPSGDIFLISDSTQGKFYEFVLQSPFDIASGVFSGVVYDTDGRAPIDFSLVKGGSSLFFVNNNGAIVRELAVGSEGSKFAQQNIGIMLGIGDSFSAADGSTPSVFSIDGSDSLNAVPRVAEGTFTGTTSKIVTDGERVERKTGLNVWRKA